MYSLISSVFGCFRALFKCLCRRTFCSDLQTHSHDVKQQPSNCSLFELASASYSDLQTRKRHLKQQLKNYDRNFARKHGRMPVKAEKEPIRHLYEKYNNLKLVIAWFEQEGDRRKHHPTPPSEALVADLKAEKRSLHTILRSYEKDFYSKHGRQVSSFDDIKPMASQYRHYKGIKNFIMSLE